MLTGVKKKKKSIKISCRLFFSSQIIFSPTIAEQICTIKKINEEKKREKICCTSPVSDCISLIAELIPLLKKEFSFFDMNKT